MVAALAPGCAFGDQQENNKDKHDDSDLCAAPRIVHHQPDVEHAGGQRLDGEKIDGAEIIQRFHQDKGNADDNGRTCHRQGYAPERCPGRAAEGPRRFADAGRLFEKRRTRQQVNIGVERHCHHDDRASQRADLGEPVILHCAPAEDIAQQRLYRAGEFKNIGVDIRDDIGRHRQRQDQRPFEYAPAGEVAGGDEPGGAYPDQDSAGSDTSHQFQCRENVSRKNGFPEMRPDVFRREKRGAQNREHGQGDDCRNKQSTRGPWVRSEPSGAAGARVCFRSLYADHRGLFSGKDPQVNPQLLTGPSL